MKKKNIMNMKLIILKKEMKMIYLEKMEKLHFVKN